jgi:hypothetical protein
VRELPRADARVLFALQEDGGKSAGGPKFYRARRYHSRFSNSQCFLILFVKSSKMERILIYPSL